MRHSAIGQERSTACYLTVALYMVLYYAFRWPSSMQLQGDSKTQTIPVQEGGINGTVLETGVSNVADKDHELTEGFPSPRRTGFVRADYFF